MTLERRLTDALSEFDDVEPSADLFARVQLALDTDRTSRRRAIKWLASSVVVLTLVSAFVMLMASRPRGIVTVPGWSITLAESVVLTSIVLAMGPAIGRFGNIYTADAFRLDPATGQRFLRLLDLAYYLVFGGYVLMVTSLSSASENVVLVIRLEDSLERIGGVLLLMGVLHATTLSVMPVVGLLHGSIVRRQRREGAGTSAPVMSPRAELAERVARWIVGVGLAAVSAFALVVVGILIGLGVGG